MKPVQLASVDWKDPSVEGPLKQGAVPSQPTPPPALGTTEKLVGVCRFPCDTQTRPSQSQDLASLAFVSD